LRLCGAILLFSGAKKERTLFFYRKGAKGAEVGFSFIGAGKVCWKKNFVWFQAWKL
jgi:hypothetical protein